MTRRTLFRASLATAAGAVPSASAASEQDIAIASANGSACCKKVIEVIRAGGDTLDAVVAGVNIVEEDPDDTSVGYGGLPNEEGVVELDACVMHGPSRRAGSVGALRGIKTPSKIAKLVMERSDHIMIVGEGVLRFAKAHGFKEEKLLTEKARLAWLMWKESGNGDWGPGLDAPPKRPGQVELRKRYPDANPEWLAWARGVLEDRPTGTINCLALNRRGKYRAAPPRAGWPGRFPDALATHRSSPPASTSIKMSEPRSTGRGEENIRIAGAHTVVENMRHGMSPEEACLDALRRVSRNYNDDKARLTFGLNFYALRKDGEYGVASLWSHSGTGEKRERRKFVVNDGSGSRHVDTAYLYLSA